ncbi:hypothetical protein PLICRDRAFT_43464 [Plicaturopsis crispa FD-325 SS-3]|nr:hypothetical protein PLICRDRAFT_43464 [Plicaturopsis crispa FD-325 SS-3]
MSAPPTPKPEQKRRSFFRRNVDEKHAEPLVHDDATATDAVTVAQIEPKGDDIQPVSFTDLFRFSTKFELFIDGIALFASILAGAAQPMMSLLFGNLTQAFVNFGDVVQDVNNGKPGAAEQVPVVAANFRKTAAHDASYLVYIGVGMFVCTYIYMYVWIYTGEVNAKRIRERYLKAVLRQDIAFFDNVGAGEVATRIQTDTHLVQQGISENVPQVFNYLSSFFTGFILAYIRSWRLALALSSILPCIAITGTIMNQFMSKYMQLSLQHVADGGTLAEEVISTIRTAHAFGTQKTLADLYDSHIEKSEKVDLKAAFWNGGGVAVVFFVIYSAYGLAFSFGTTLINRGQTTPGAVVNVFLAILIGSFSLALLSSEMQAITYGCGAAAKLYATIDRVPPIDSADPSGLKPEKCEGEIVLEHVNFNYPSRPDIPVVKDLSLTFPAGKTAALVGASGSGKSTVVSLVERFYDPLSGAVKLDGVDLKELNIKWLRSQIGLVSQEPTLFATTVKENVMHGLIGTAHEHAPEEEKFRLVKDACIKANADDFILRLPAGYDTVVVERGANLSGGQKQRIAIARAIVSDPRILLMDEATSALDTQSEGIVQDALDKASAGRTTITIAHRLSTVKDAARIFVMGDGLVLEQGTHSELLANPDGPYSRLVQTQRLREQKDAVEKDGIDSDAGSVKETEKVQKDNMPLARWPTEHSLAGKRQKELGPVEKKGGNPDHSLPYLFMRIGKLNREGWLSYGIGSIFAIMSGMVYPAFGIVYAKGIKGFSDSTNSERRFDGDRNALWFFIIAILSMISLGFQNYLFASAAATLTSKLRSLSFRAMLRQDVAFFDKDDNSAGGLTSSLSDNAQKVNGLAGITLGVIVQSVSTLIAGSVIGLAFGWKLALVGIVCTPALISTGYIRLRVVVFKDQKNKAAHESSAQLACEAAGAIRTVAALTREDDCCALYSESLRTPLENSNRSAAWSNLLYSLSQAMIFFVIALVFWYGSRLVAGQEYSTLQFFVCLMSTMFGAIQAGNVFSFVPDVSSAKGAGSDIIKLLDAQPAIDAESPGGKTVETAQGQGRVRLENIHFRYPARPDVHVLRGLSLVAEPGTYIALVGASGSGKSTVIQLIERFYDPVAGQVYLDEERITDLNIQEYRKQLALVSQEPTLYSGTIRFNILLGAVKPASEVSQEEIEDACRNANILDFIQSLPDGFDTDVGGKGSQLSGGQKQRIAIARALLRNPKVLLLDEATSALDSNSEKVVQEALDKAAKGRTTIAVAHRLSTIQNADCIYFVKEGRVSESGTHDELLRLRGDYYAYVQLQALSPGPK